MSILVGFKKFNVSKEFGNILQISTLFSIVWKPFAKFRQHVLKAGHKNGNIFCKIFEIAKLDAFLLKCWGLTGAKVC